ncbi:LuxR C-terminal-related transcriptional regulator [Nocardiopsis sp. NPDC007018]|uniref:LuxR C-terminal-related transcriptional regulator n=1 Tax=Nocardiopsis sp. NPDC007018 TaxID=3155721 RepID=UPI0033E67F55
MTERDREPQSVRLRGRDTERGALADALGDARSGRGTALLLTGGPGRGRSLLLDHAHDTAGDFTVLRVAGVRTETDLPCSGLQRLLRPVLSGLDRLPASQRDLLREALTRGVLTAADRYPLYTAVLELLSEASAERPLLLCVDDAELLDPASLDALAFAARRLTGTRIAAAFTARDGHTAPTEPGPVPGVTELVLAPLEDRAVHDLLTDRAPAQLSPRVREELVRAAHGNPAAALGFLSTLSPEQVRDREPLPEPLPLAARLRSALLAPYEELPEGARRLLLLGALADAPPVHQLLDADRDPEPHAPSRTGPAPSVSTLEPAEERDLVRVDGDTLVFLDPLLREAVVQGAPAGRLRGAHRALAGVTDREHAPVEFARHAACGAEAPDAELADRISAAARRAKHLSGPLAASRTHERAAALSPDPDERACRLATASHESHLAGEPERAARLLARARPLVVSDRRRAVVDLIEAEFQTCDSNAIDSAERLYAAGRDLIPHDRWLALRALVRSADSASYAGDPVRHARAAELAVPLVRPDDPPSMRLIAAFLEGCTVSFRGDYVNSTPLLREAIRLSDGMTAPSELVWAGICGLRLGDAPFVRTATSRAAESARSRGELVFVPSALAFLVFSEFWSGRFPSAAGTALAGLRASRESGQSIWEAQNLAALAMVAAIQGDVDTCRIRARAVAAQAGEKSLGLPSALASWAQAVLELSRGNAADAFFRLRSLVHAGPGHGHPTMRLVTAPHFVEAAVRTGKTGWARASQAGYRGWAEAVGSRSALALAARGDGLLTTGEEAVDHFEAALDLHRACGDDDVEHARTQLLFGASLRRSRLPGRAREHLYNALETFERFGARLWVRQTRAELRAIGTAERGPQTPATSDLTAQQQQIAQLVAEGATNREVAAHMFISPRTVEHHLRGIFRKLNIRSRVDLARLLN